MALHLELKFVISHFVYIGTHGIFQVSSWKSVFVFRLLKFIEDAVCGIKRILIFDWKFSVYLPFIFSNLGSGIPYLQVYTEYFKFPLNKNIILLLSLS